MGTDRRRAGRRLTSEQQELVLSAEKWLWQEVNRAPLWLQQVHGRDGVEQVARLAVIKSAMEFDPVSNPGVPFGAYARRLVRWHLTRLCVEAAQRGRVWREMPDAEGEWQPDPADHRREECDPALKLWCGEDYSEQRKCLDWRSRVLLYLRTVEGWTLEEVGDAVGVTRYRVRQLEEKAVRKLAAFRNRRLLMRQLAGLPA